MENFSLLSWNIRGACNLVARKLVNKMVSTNKVNFLCLQETKCGKWTTEMINSMWNVNNVDWCEVKSEGLSGGLLCSWNKSEFKLLSCNDGRNWIWCHFQNSSDSSFFHIINVYGPQELEDKQDLWDNLRKIMEQIGDKNLCLVGDFNCIRDESERVGCIYRRRDLVGFNEFIHDSNLLDLEIVNSLFTWFGPQGKKSKLDRALVNANWMDLGQWTLKALCRSNSDHRPLLLKIENLNWGPKPFKVFNCWLKEESLKSIVDGYLKLNSNTVNLDSQSLVRRFKSLIKDWANNPDYNVEVRIKRIEESLNALDSKDSKSYSYNEGVVIKEELDHLYDLKTQVLRQKARVNWSSFGDKNTKFNHKVVKKRQNRNTIRKILWQGELISCPKRIKEAFYTHFSSLFSVKKQPVVLKLGNLKGASLSKKDSEWLERDIDGS